MRSTKIYVVVCNINGMKKIIQSFETEKSAKFFQSAKQLGTDKALEVMDKPRGFTKTLPPRKVFEIEEVDHTNG